VSRRGPIAVDPLDLHPHLVPRLCEEFTREWPVWCGSVTRRRLEACFASASDGGLPIVFVAHDDGLPLGTVSLRPWFAEEPMPESPWVRGLLVFPEFRGGGVFRALESAVERHARDHGYSYLYAGTTAIERSLSRRGWELFRRVPHDGQDMAWMRKLVSGTHFQGGAPSSKMRT